MNSDMEKLRYIVSSSYDFDNSCTAVVETCSTFSWTLTRKYVVENVCCFMGNCVV